jgi:hypothetical protein
MGRVDVTIVTNIAGMRRGRWPVEHAARSREQGLSDFTEGGRGVHTEIRYGARGVSAFPI